MNENQIKITPQFVIELIKRRRWFIMLPFCLVLIGGINYVLKTPRIYEAKTLILVEGQRVPQSFVQSIVTEDPGERINTITQQILSRTNLEKIVDEFSLFSGPGNETKFMEDKIAGLRKNIFVNVIADRQRQTDAFEISFKGEDPQKVMQVVNGLASSFIDENMKSRRDQAIGTSAFLESELESMRVRLEQLEEKIKNYRKANMGELPEQLETNLRILDRFQDNLSDRQKSLREAKIRLSGLRSQASVKHPSVVVIGGGDRDQNGGATMEELVGELETMESRYTDKHPDVIRLKKQIADMKSRTRSNRGVSTRIPIELRAQISEAKREIQGVEIDIRELESQIFNYQQRIENTPKREQELLSLKRDYQNIHASYDSLLNRKLEADIGLNMEQQKKGEQFRIVDRARLPQRPVEPDMKKVFLMVIVAGLGLGGGLAYLFEYMDTSFRKSDDLESALNVPVMATIPIILNHKQVIMARLNTVGSVATALLCFCLLCAFSVISVLGG